MKVANTARQKNRQSRSQRLLEEFKTQTNMKLTFCNYKPARLYTANKDTSKEWYIIYSYLIPGTTNKYKQFKERFGINRFQSASERYEWGKSAERFMNQKLQQGFNPFEEINVASPAKLPFIEQQLKIIIEENTRSASKSKINSYNEQSNRLIKYIRSEGLNDISMHELNEDHAENYKDYLDHDLNLSVKTINNSLSYLKKFWKYAIRKKWCAANPFAEVERMNKNQKEVTKEKYVPLTMKELGIIMTHLTETGQRDYLRFIAMIFYAWARPAEIARLRVGDINLEQDLIRFPKGETKNKEGAFVQIVPPLKKLLEEMKLEQYDPHLFLFSGDGAGFKPGKKQLTRHRPSDRWSDIVKMELKINKDQYGLKHTGNIQYLLMNTDNVNLKWQQMQNRHSNPAMTQKYNDRIGAYFIKMEGVKFEEFE